MEGTPIASVFTLIGALRFPWWSIGFGCAYLIGQFVFSHSYQRNGANTGAKCLGRIITKYSIWILAGLAMASSILLIKEHKSLERLVELFRKK